MTPSEYLLACGWTRDGSFPGGGDQWLDPIGKKQRDTYGTKRVIALDTSAAVHIQLDRDAARRDYVDLYRPKAGPQ